MATYSKLGSGKIRVQIRKKGLYYNQTFENKNDAAEWATKIEKEIRYKAQLGLFDKKANLGLVIDDYLEKTGLKNKTIISSLNQIKILMGHVKLSNLSHHDVEIFVKKRLENCKSSTVVHDLSNLLKICRWANKSNAINIDFQIINYIRKDLVSRTRYREKDIRRVPSISEIRKLKKWWSEHQTKIPMVEIIMFLMITGMNLKEICSIEKSNVDIEKAIITIRRKNRTLIIHLNNELLCIIKRKIESCSNYLFPYKPESISSNFSNTCKKLNIKELSIYNFRVFYVMRLMYNTFNVKNFSNNLDYRTLNLIRNYAHDVYSELNTNIEDQIKNELEILLILIADTDYEICYKVFHNKFKSQ